MENEFSITSRKDTLEGLTRILYRSLQSSQDCNVYANQAQEAGDAALAEFFRELHFQDLGRAEQIRHLIKEKNGWHP